VVTKRKRLLAEIRFVVGPRSMGSIGRGSRIGLKINARARGRTGAELVRFILQSSFDRQQ